MSWRKKTNLQFSSSHFFPCLRPLSLDLVSFFVFFFALVFVRFVVRFVFFMTSVQLFRPASYTVFYREPGTCIV